MASANYDRKFLASYLFVSPNIYSVRAAPPLRLGATCCIWCGCRGRATYCIGCRLFADPAAAWGHRLNGLFGVAQSCCNRLPFDCAPWIIRPGKCSHRQWADAVPAHVHLLCLSEGLAVGAVGDDVVAWKALGLVQFGRLQHPQADVDDHVRCTLYGHGDQCQAVAGGDGRCWLVGVAHILGAVIADQ